MTAQKEPIKLKKKRKHPHRCQVPGCKKRGEPVVITVDESGEAGVRLCENHYSEARKVGQ